MIISKDLSLTQNEEGFGLALFSWSSARKIIITDDELPLLINALQAEYAAQQMRAADGAKCACPEPQISTLVNPGFCIICKLPRR